MKAIMETLFDVIYLATVIVLGLQMVLKAKDNKYIKLFGYMSLLLGCGDAFHLIPRAYGLLTTGLEAHAAALGFGKLITSITMTIFYIILYKIWQIRFNKQNVKSLSYTLYGLAILRIVLCLFPQNEWFNYYAPITWGIYRNIPFAIMGLIIIYILYKEGKAHKDKDYIYMSLAVLLSFGFYIPVVLFATSIPIVGMLMIPKTLAYVWIIGIGYTHFKQDKTK